MNCRFLLASIAAVSVSRVAAQTAAPQPAPTIAPPSPRSERLSGCGEKAYQ